MIITTANGGRPGGRRDPLNPAPALPGGVPRTTARPSARPASTPAGARRPNVTRTPRAPWQQVALTNAVAVTSVRSGAIDACTVLVNDGTTTWSASTADFGQTWTTRGICRPGSRKGGTSPAPPASPAWWPATAPTTTGHGQGAVVISLDGGTTWVASHVPAGVGLLQSATCASSIVCLAVGTTSTTVSDIVPAKGELLVSNDGGENWTISPHAPSVDDIYGVACPLVRTCAMVGTQWVGQPRRRSVPAGRCRPWSGSGRIGTGRRTRPLRWPGPPRAAAGTSPPAGAPRRSAPSRPHARPGDVGTNRGRLTPWISVSFSRRPKLVAIVVRYGPMGRPPRIWVTPTWRRTTTSSEPTLPCMAISGARTRWRTPSASHS